MRGLQRSTWLGVVLALTIAPAGAAEVAAADSAVSPCTNGQSLLEVVADTGRRLNKKFLIDPRADRCIAAGMPVDLQKLSYRQLQALLALHGFIDTAEVDGVISIVPDAIARQLPVRLIDDGTRDVGELDMVMKIVDAAPLSAAQLVPILRPLLPQYAHLVAADQNTLLIAGRYGNVRSLEGLVRKLRQRPLVPAREEGAK